MSGVPTLQVHDLQTYFYTRQGVAPAVDGVSFELGKGEIMGLVGESGSGKSVTGFSIIGLVDEPGRIQGGSIKFKGAELLSMPADEYRQLRGDRISMIFQDPMMTLNPVLRIETQVIEAIRGGSDLTGSRLREYARDALGRVGIPGPEERLRAYPHELSGGMRQRVAIAIALLNRPDLIIADEPTTALDVTIQAQILAQVQSLCRESGTSLIWISHDLSVVASLADTVCVMYAGKIVEAGNVDDVILHPKHPYTDGLINSLPSRNRRGVKLAQIPGVMPSLLELPQGCSFRPRCPLADVKCRVSPNMRSVKDNHNVRCVHPIVSEEIL